MHWLTSGYIVIQPKETIWGGGGRGNVLSLSLLSRNKSNECKGGKGCGEWAKWVSWKITSNWVMERGKILSLSLFQWNVNNVIHFSSMKSRNFFILCSESGMQFNLPLWSFLVLVVALIGGIFAQRCPFPGIPANAHATANRQPVTWKQRTNYRIGDKIAFTCEDGWSIPSFHQPEIECRNDGTWSGPLPRCGQFN